MGLSRRLIAVIGGAVVVVAAAGTGAAVELTGSTAHTEPRPAHAAAALRPSRTAVPAPLERATVRVVHKRKPKPKPKPKPSPTYVYQPTPQPAPTAVQPTSAPTYQQQDCYAEPHPTCTVPPPPGSLLTQMRITDPTPAPVNGGTVSNAP
jgi:hypothetical protein